MTSLKKMNTEVESYSQCSVKFDKRSSPRCTEEHTLGPVCNNVCHVKQFSKLILKQWKFSLDPANSCVQFNNGDIGVMRNVLQTACNETFILYERFQTVSSFLSILVNQNS